jgi:hypothetical protein
MFKWQLPPFLIFGIYSAFIHPLFRRKGELELEDKEDVVVKRIQRGIEIKWGWYCVLSLLLWISLIVGLVVLIVKTTSDDDKKALVSRWISSTLWETWKVYY